MPFDEPNLGPEPGWVSSEPLAALASRRNFVHDDPDGERIRIAYYRRPNQTALLAKVWFGVGAEGPPGHAHGGSVMAVLDEIAGGCLWVNGYRVVLARFESNLRAPLPLGTVVIAEGDIESVDGRKIYATGVLRGLDGTVYVDARGLFVQLDEAKMQLFLSAAAALHDEPTEPGDAAPSEAAK